LTDRHLGLSPHQGLTGACSGHVAQEMTLPGGPDIDRWLDEL